jgi:hypothetical protein
VSFETSGCSIRLTSIAQGLEASKHASVSACAFPCFLPSERPPFAVAKSMSLFSIPYIEPWLVYQDNPTLENR